VNDPTEATRRQRVVEINAAPRSREALEARYGRVWDADELREHFDVQGFLAPYVFVVRTSNGVKGSLEFQHSPRLYFNCETA
jgi:hypothetical protein